MIHLLFGLVSCDVTKQSKNKWVSGVQDQNLLVKVVYLLVTNRAREINIINNVSVF